MDNEELVMTEDNTITVNYEEEYTKLVEAYRVLTRENTILRNTIRNMAGLL